MALRVLLADESSTLKKVFQLALQDYAVEVSNVNSGMDVASVSSTFKPDVIFADILLPKKNGYEVAAEVKSVPELTTIPVILMWSPFMEMDEDRFLACQASDRLEKPFDIETLRALVQKWVPKTKTHKLSQFLKFPNLSESDFGSPSPPVQIEAPKTQAQANPPEGNLNFPPLTEGSFSTPPPIGEKLSPSNWNMESFDPISSFSPDLTQPHIPNLTQPPEQPPEQHPEEEEFVRAPLKSGTNPLREAPPPVSEAEPWTPLEEENQDWVQKDISQFRVKMDVDNIDEDSDLPVEFVVNDLDQREDVFELEEEASPIPLELESKEEEAVSHVSAVNPNFVLHPPDRGPKRQNLEGSEVRSSVAAVTSLNQENLEELVNAQIKQIVENIVWKVVPDLAQQIIERELQRLLSEKHDGP